jgi:outer membrane lipoprotein SlyB
MSHPGKAGGAGPRRDWAAAGKTLPDGVTFRQMPLIFPCSQDDGGDLKQPVLLHLMAVHPLDGRVLPLPILKIPNINKRSRVMNQRIAVPVLLLMALAGGCAEMGSLGGPKYGETNGAMASQTERDGTIAKLESIEVDDKYKLGVGTAVGAVAGGIIGAGVGDSTTATAVGAVLGGVAGTYAESKIHKQDAQRVTVNMKTGGTVTIVQPMDGNLREGMAVRVEGSGENARVVPR